jgi:hypothetical protein
MERVERRLGDQECRQERGGEGEAEAIAHGA